MNPSPDKLVYPDDPHDKIAWAIQENAVAGVEAWAQWPGLELRQKQGLTWLSSDIPFFVFNNVLRCDAPAETVDASIERIIAETGVPLAWWVTSLSQPEDLAQRLESKGLGHMAELPAMAVDLHNLNEGGSVPPGVSIERVADDESLASWSRVICEVNEFPDFVADAWLEIYRKLGLGENVPWGHFLASLNGEAVSACSVFLGNGVAGLHSVSTLPKFRRMGIGTAITLEALKYARRMGYRLGTLFSSEMAVKIYRRLGFREYFQGHLYVWPGNNGGV